ncbi:MAG: M1 family metallopeptidase [FCB group bacterium]|nr:M1 family metallopeptidase [FCB group bacterium]
MKRWIILFIPLTMLWCGNLPPDYFQQDVAYDIQVTLDDENHTLSANERLEYTNNSPDTLNFIWFHLWPNAYKDNTTALARQMLKNGGTRFYFSSDKQRGYIDSLNFKVNGVEALWNFHPQWIDVAKVMLPQPLLPGQTIVIETPFFVKLPEIFSRMGHTEQHYEITQWYPKPAVYDLEGWHPMPYLNQGEFYSEFGTFDVTITLPRDYVVMATGDLVDGAREYAWLDSLAAEGAKVAALSKKELKTWRKKQMKAQKKRARKAKKQKKEAGAQVQKTLHYRQEKVHDFAWFADRDYVVQKGSLTTPELNREVTLWSAYLPKNAELWRDSIEYLHDSGYWYSVFYGDYPYNHITAVDGDLSAGGGMEYPNITVISTTSNKEMLEMVIMHEVGHNWVYGILGSNERDHAWMDEGLNEYSNFLYWDKKYGWKSPLKVLPDKFPRLVLRNADFAWLLGYTGYQSRAFTRDDQPIEQTSEAFNIRNYGADVYAKTGVFTYFLHHFLGEATMFGVLHDYYQTWKFHHPRPADFKAIFDEQVDIDLSWYFDGVLNSTDFVDYAITDVSRDSITIVNKGNLKAPLQLAFCDLEKNLQISRGWYEGFTGSKTIPLENPGLCVRIDPYEILPDIDRSNNVSHRSCVDATLIADKPNYFSFYLGNVIPVGRLNAYNVGIGIGLQRGTFPKEYFDYSISPAFDLANNTLIGSARIEGNYYRVAGLDELHPFAGYDRNQGRESLYLGSKFIFRQPIVSDPLTSLTIEGWRHNFRKRDIFDPQVWKTDQSVTSVRLKLKYFRKLTPLLKLNKELTLRYAANSDLEFSGASFNSQLTWRMTRKYKLGGHLSATRVFQSGLTQYQPAVGGTLDPDFESYVWDRSAGGDFTLLQRQFVPGVASMRIAPVSAGTNYTTALAFGGEVGNFLMAGLFADFLYTPDDLAISGGIYHQLFSAGLSVDLKLLKIYLPLYMNWEPSAAIGDRVWRDHIRAEIVFTRDFLKFGR